MRLLRKVVCSSAFRRLVQVNERRRLQAELHTFVWLISKSRAALLISLNAVCNEVGLSDKQTERLILFGFGKTESQERAPGFNLLATDYRQLVTDNKETTAIRQVFIYSPGASLQLSVVSIYLIPPPTLFINPFNISPPPRRG
jgi:hypothetical protein